MADLKHVGFDPAVFLAQAGLGRRAVQLKPKAPFFSQGDTADCVYYLQSGRAKLTVISSAGKEATIALLTWATSWARVFGRNAGIADGDGHSDHPMFGAQD